MVNKIFFFVL